MAMLSNSAQRAEREHNNQSLLEIKNLGPFNIKSKENSKKAYFKEFKKVVKMADVILEVRISSFH